ELFFAQDHDTNKVFNRITHNFTKKLLFTRLIVALRKHGIAVFLFPRPTLRSSAFSNTPRLTD
ncbi:hypothetical protein, partial [Hydrogenibacillus schlegelii]|uniref:hypothetical protein n=1 Tax=Hydrogenibacillus schlegelii TaxID=1484 RepID=UPI0034A06526